jgi:hypothetical protein
MLLPLAFLARCRRVKLMLTLRTPFEVGQPGLVCAKATSGTTITILLKHQRRQNLLQGYLF